MLTYGAGLIVEALRPVVLTIGRSAYVARPLSTPVMLAMQAVHGGSDVEKGAALVMALRAAFPRAPWYRRWRPDPVRQILTLPLDLQGHVLAALFKAPGSDRDRRADESPLEKMRREQRAAVHGTARQHGHVPTLAVALAVVRAAYGDQWYYNPDRWPTADGYAPFAVTWVEYMALQTVEMRRRLERADSVSLALAKDGAKARRSIMDAAFPTEMMH